MPSFDPIIQITVYHVWCPVATSTAWQSSPAPNNNNQTHDWHGFLTNHESNEFLSLAQCLLPPIHDYDIALALSHLVPAPVVLWLGCSPAHQCVPGLSPGIPFLDSIIHITVFHV